MIECRQCGSTDLKDRGRITRGRYFAGHALNPVWPGGSLLECRQCALVFRAPIHNDHVYEELYKTAAETVYASNSLRHDQELAREVILRRHGAGNILDVGCFDGALLHSLGKNFQKFGVEASHAAVEICRGRDIEIVSSNIRDLPTIARQFDVICAIDVIEHVANPLAFIAMLKRLVRPGGSIIISTGNAHARSWRLFGGRYWYCSFPEHISFLSPAWVWRAAAKLHLNVAVLRQFRHVHSKASKAHALIGFAKRLAVASIEYALSPLFAEYARVGPRFVLGFPGVAEDHMLIVLEPAESTSGHMAHNASMAARNSLASTCPRKKHPAGVGCVPSAET